MKHKKHYSVIVRDPPFGEVTESSGDEMHCDDSPACGVSASPDPAACLMEWNEMPGASKYDQAPTDPTHGGKIFVETVTYTARESDAYHGLHEAQTLAHATATDAGWYRDPKTGAPIQRNVGEVIALMHSELSEALEAYRKDLMDNKLPHRRGIEVEFADCIIRILDTAAAMRLDVPGAFIEKNRFNRTRADHSLEARAQDGGKKF